MSYIPLSVAITIHLKLALLLKKKNKLLLALNFGSQEGSGWLFAEKATCFFCEEQMGIKVQVVFKE